MQNNLKSDNRREATRASAAVYKSTNRAIITSPMTSITRVTEEVEKEEGSVRKNPLLSPILSPNEELLPSSLIRTNFPPPSTPTYTHKVPAAAASVAVFWLSADSLLWCFSGCSTYVVYNIVTPSKTTIIAQ